MSTVQGTFELTTSFQQALSTLPGTPTIKVPQRLSATYGSSGSAGAADQADVKHTKTYVFSASTPQSIDLTAAVDAFGTVNFARVRSITVNVRTTTNGQTLTLGGASSNPWTGIFSGTYTIPAATASSKSVYAQTAPNTTGYLVSGTSKVLKMDPGSAAFEADVEITGCSA